MSTARQQATLLFQLAGFAAHLGWPAMSTFPTRCLPRGWPGSSATALTCMSPGDYDCAYDEAEEAGARAWLAQPQTAPSIRTSSKAEQSRSVARTARLDRSRHGRGPGWRWLHARRDRQGLRELLKSAHRAMPQLLGAQAATMQPIVQRQRGEAPYDDTGPTRAASVAVRAPRNARAAAA